MKAPWSGQLSAVQSGWLMALLFFGFLAFLLIPGPKPKPEPLPAFVVKPPSRLVALGLPDNPDLEALPEFFALFADQAEWRNDKTIFAYWNPGSNSHSYFFEATRANGGYHFEAIPELKNVNPEAEYSQDSDPRWSRDISEQSPIRFIKRSQNVFMYDEAKHSFEWFVKMRARELSAPRKKRVEIDAIKTTQPSVPDLNLPLLELESKK